MVNSDLGGRQAGSKADQEVSTFLEGEMRRIGLSRVRKEAFPVDTWQFNGARLEALHPEDGVQSGREIKPYSYASGGTGPEGIEADLVFAGKGTRRDYEDLDVKGKIVLIDIDMENDWWINYPTLEATHHGAAALINSCSAGYGQLNDTTMNTQDFCGPVTIPSVNITRADAACLKDLLSRGTVRVTLMVDNVVRPGGTSWNVVGEIPGKREDIRVIVGDHHDCHFSGFQDNNTGVAAALTIAKAMIDSGYTPEHSLVFVLHGAEEWGAIDNRYDWQVGAWRQVHTLHPEWVGSTLAFINFEMPGMSGSSSFSTHATPEFHRLLQQVYRLAERMGLALPEQFTGGFKAEDPLLTTWSDAWTYADAGIPSFENYAGYREGDSAFSVNIYHSNYDTADLFQEDVFEFNVAFYGLLAMVIDQLGYPPLDFATRADRLNEAADYALIEETGGKESAEALRQALKAFREAAEELNDAYSRDVDIHRVLEAFCGFQEHLVRLDWEDEQVYRFEQPQRNVIALRKAVTALENADRKAAAAALAEVDDNGYALYFSRAVVQHEYEQLFGEANRDKLFWGTGKISGYHDLYDAMAVLEGRDPEVGADLRLFDNPEEVQHQVRDTLSKEEPGLADEITHTTRHLQRLTDQIRAIVRDTRR